MNIKTITIKSRMHTLVLLHINTIISQILTKFETILQQLSVIYSIAIGHPKQGRYVPRPTKRQV